MNLLFKQHRRTALIGLGAVVALPTAWLVVSLASKNPGSPTFPKQENTVTALDTTLVMPPPQAREEGQIRKDIQSAIDPTTPLARRTELITSLPNDLTEAEWSALIREVITLPTPNTPQALHSSHVHEICVILQDVEASHDLFANALATVAANRDFTDIYRDYALQHLRTLWRNSLDPRAPGVVQPRNTAIELTFRKLLTDRPELSAKAILGLHEFRHLNGTPAVPDEEINALVRQILDTKASVDSTQIPARMTAVRVIAERKLPDSHDLLRAIAGSAEEHSLVRISAIGSIGHNASPEDKSFLTALSTDDPLIAEALQHALKQF